MIHKWMVEDQIVKNLISKYDVEHYDFLLHKDEGRMRMILNSTTTLIVLKEVIES